MNGDSMKTMVERLVFGGPLTGAERQMRNQEKDAAVNHMIHSWFSEPEFLPQLLAWDAHRGDWIEGASDDDLSSAIDDCENKIWVDGEVQPHAKYEMVKGMILIRQRYRALSKEEANIWNEQKLQLAEMGGFYLSEESLSQAGYPSRLLFISDLLRKLYHCFAGEIDFGGSIGRCGIRGELHHTQEWEEKFTALLRQGAPLSELLDTFSLEDLVNYGW